MASPFCCARAVAWRSTRYYRSLYEADLQMSWILEADTDQRARTYWVAHLLKEQRRCQSELKGSEYRTSASEQFPDLEWRDEAAIRAEIANIESVLNRPERHDDIRTESAEKRNRKFWAARLWLRELRGDRQEARPVERV